MEKMPGWGGTRSEPGDIRQDGPGRPLRRGRWAWVLKDNQPGKHLRKQCPRHWGQRSVPNRRSNMVKSPEAGRRLVCSRGRKQAVWLEGKECKGWEPAETTLGHMWSLGFYSEWEEKLLGLSQWLRVLKLYRVCNGPKGNESVVSQKLKHRVTTWPNNSQENWSRCSNSTCSRMFREALFSVAQRDKQPKCLSADHG